MMDPAAARLNSFKYGLLKRSGTCMAPRRCTLYLTYRCNLKCEMCFQRSLNHRQPEMSLADIRRLLAALDVDELFLCGGEIFVRQDIYEVFALVEELGIRTTLLTNGTMIHAQGLAFLAQARHIHRIVVSLDGLQETHDRVRGRGTFLKATAAIQALAPSKEVWTNTVILPSNVDELTACASLYRELGAERVTFQFEMSYTKEEYERSDCALRSSGIETSLSRDTVRASLAFDYIPRLEAAIREIRCSPASAWVHYSPEIFADDLSLYANGDIRNDREVCCEDFIQPHLKIGPRGEFEVCEAMHAACGNVLDSDPLSLWNSEPASRFRQHLVKSNMVDLCSRCCRVTTLSTPAARATVERPPTIAVGR